MLAKERDKKAKRIINSSCIDCNYFDIPRHYYNGIGICESYNSDHSEDALSSTHMKCEYFDSKFADKDSLVKEIKSRK